MRFLRSGICRMRQLVARQGFGGEGGGTVMVAEEEVKEASICPPDVLPENSAGTSPDTACPARPRHVPSVSRHLQPKPSKQIKYCRI